MKSNEDSVLLNNYIDQTKMNDDLKLIYNLINDEELKKEINNLDEIELLCHQNNEKYNNISIKQYLVLPDKFDDQVDIINAIYNSIDKDKLFIVSSETALNYKKIIDNLYIKIDKLNKSIQSYCIELESENDRKQSVITHSYIENLSIDKDIQQTLINLYEDLIIYNKEPQIDEIENLKKQLVRNQKISEIIKLIDFAEQQHINQINKEKLPELNAKIEQEINAYKQKINYLDDLIPGNSKYMEDFINFKNFYNKIISYNDENYNEARQTYELLTNESQFNKMINEFEKKFISEINLSNSNNKNNEQILSDFKTTLDYINNNYINELTLEEKNQLDYINKQIDNNSYNVFEISKAIKLMVENIWKNNITKISKYKSEENFCFLCTNNQFIDIRHETMLLTSNELSIMDNLLDYEIGFICDYNDNILYITQSNNIMEPSLEDMSVLKTPKQIEGEFINTGIKNSIVLDGYNTKIVAVYYIKTNEDIPQKALDLAYAYELPLIQLNIK